VQYIPVSNYSDNYLISSVRCYHKAFQSGGIKIPQHAGDGESGGGGAERVKGEGGGRRDQCREGIDAGD
jgi:hypothetical protein